MLDDLHASLPIPESDHNTYQLGEIGNHNIVIACLPSGVYGHVSASVVAQQMQSTFPSVRFGLMVGIGGGAPSDAVDIRLGDIVVSKPTDNFGGVVQYDFGKTMADGVLHRTGTLNKPPEVLLTAMANLQANHSMGENHLSTHLQNALEEHPSMRSWFIYPGQDNDILYEPTYDHPQSRTSCDGCDAGRRVVRSPRTSTAPIIHYGLIASANQVMKDSRTRDRLAQKWEILCYEMEAAGLMDHFPCLVIRGICDYSDSHKNKQWQNYAAGTSAAYAKEILQVSLSASFTPGKVRVFENIHSRIPIPKTTFFGRKDELDKIEEYLESSSPGRKGVVIGGLSGYGKTQLAIHYLTVRRSSYNSILWIDASCQSAIDESFEGLASQIASNYKPDLTAVGRVLMWLEEAMNSSWIVVYDGVESDSMEDEEVDFDLKKYIPSSDHGHIILTTTASDLCWRMNLLEIHIEGVTDEAGAEILWKCARIRSPDNHAEVTSRAISRKLGGVPLALEQAGSFLSYGVTSLSDYNRQLEDHLLDETLHTPMRKHVGSYEKKRTLWSAFDLLHDALCRRSKRSASLLHLLVFLARGPIPFAVISGRKPVIVDSDNLAGQTSLLDLSDKLLPAPCNLLSQLRHQSKDLATSIQELEISGLVKLSRSPSDAVIENLIIHDMVRVFIRSKLSNEETEENLASSFLILGQTCYDSDGKYKTDVLKSYIPQLTNVQTLFLSHIPRQKLQPPDGKYFALCGSVAPVYAKASRSQGTLQTASDFWEIALQYRLLTQKHAWPKHKADLEMLQEAADIDVRLGNLKVAVENYMSLLTHCEHILPESDEMTVAVASALRDARETYEQREREFKRAVATQSSAKLVSARLHEGPEVDDEEWEHKMAYEEAISLLGPNDPETARLAEKLAKYYQKHNRSEEEYYREYLWQYNIQRYGHHNAFTAMSLRELCICYEKEGNLKDKLRNDLYQAPKWAVFYAPSEFKEWLLKIEASRILDAASNGEVDVAHDLLGRHDPVTAFCWVARLQSSPAKEALMPLFADLNLADDDIIRSLVTCQDKDATLKLFRAYGFDLSAASKNGNTPLHNAQAYGSIHLIRALLDHGADVSKPNTSGTTPLHRQATNITSLGIARLLLESGADVNATDLKGNTPLHWVATMGSSYSVIDMAELLLAWGADGFLINASNFTAFDLACKSDHDQVAKLIIKHNSTRTYEEGQTMLHRIIQNPTVSIILIETAIDNCKDRLNVQDTAGETPLHYATRTRNIEAVSCLLDCGADPTIKSLDRKTPVDCIPKDGTPDANELRELFSDYFKNSSSESWISRWMYRMSLFKR
ncbi:hypothetical protein BDV25DRAFT_151245 [Aspergillus avenaceus]|uniref:Nucleoside phosphorylase domain-containing protein n=1 Tax=Aspergillus avenaceus TaxID=36643 RepID=A0A5N6U1H8_ASPAV|nr:hypothetical protein BDV25DRAFT_151245 [Aspergillus avenaceus]